MCSRFLDERYPKACWRGLVAWLLMSSWAALAQAGPESSSPLRVCADPDNPPFSQRDESGFENHLARLLAEDLGQPLQYTWLRDRRWFIRKTLLSGQCDVVMGVPVGLRSVRTTSPYYRSGFYFVARAGSQAMESFTDTRLPGMKVGVQLIGIDPGTSPVGYALARHGATRGIVGYTVAEDDHPPAQRMVQAVANGVLDLALLWGPQIAHFAQESAVPLRITLAKAPPDMAGIPFEFSVAMATRPEDDNLHQRLESFLVRQRDAVDRLLSEHGVLRTDLSEAQP